MIFWIGLQPRFFLDRMAPTLDDLIDPAMQAVDAVTKREMTKEAEKSGERNSSSDSELRSDSSFIVHPFVLTMTTAALHC